MGTLARAAGLTLATTTVPALGWVWYTRATQFVPFTTASSDFTSAIAQELNPNRNLPVCIDHAVRSVPLAKLSTTNEEALTRQFCQGIWAGPGFIIQRLYLQRKYRVLEGRGDHLWD